VRRLAAEHGLTRLTVYSAYSELQAQGLVESHVGRSTFVASGSPAQITEQPRPISRPEWGGEGLIAALLRDRGVFAVPDGVLVTAGA